jgi:hypothetical protein
MQTESQNDQTDQSASLTRIAEVAELVVTILMAECAGQTKPEKTPKNSWTTHELAAMDRNDYICFLYRLGFYQAEIGRWVGLGQPRVGQIIRERQK